MDAQDFLSLQKAYMEVYASPEQIDEAFKPMNEPKMQDQMKRHLKRDVDDIRFSNMKTALKVIGTQQKSKGFKEKKTEKGRRTFAKQNANKFLRKDDWHGSKDKLGRKLTVPGRHIIRDEEGHKKHLDRLKKSDVSAESYDVYDIILSHLLDEGYATDVKSAEVIMANMSEEWRNDIVEGKVPKKG